MKLIVSALVVFNLILCSVVNADEASHKAAAEELLKLTKTDQLIKPLFAQMSSMMEQQFTVMGVPEDKRPKLKKYADKLFMVIEDQMGWDKMKNDYITIYISTFSEDEIRSISAFYRTPAGQTYIQKMPQLMKTSVELSQKKMPAIMKAMEQIATEMVQEMEAEMKSKSGQENKRTSPKGI